MTSRKRKEPEPTSAEERKEPKAKEAKVLLSNDVGKVVFPGDAISLPPNTKVRIGAGLTQDNASVVSTKCGILKQPERGKLILDTAQKRYMPAVDDLVVGVVIEKHTETYRIDIGTTHPARLSALAFEGATKRNKPNIPVGALVYARVISCNKHMDTELSCISPHFKKEWVTGQSLFGELAGGYKFDCSLRLARSLLDEKCTVLKTLGRHVPFELAIGANGAVWVNSSSPDKVIVICNAIQNSEHMTDDKTVQMVQLLVGKLSDES